MNYFTTAAAVLLGTTTMAAAGGIERSTNDYGVLFEEGDYLTLGFSYVNPTVTGDYPVGLGGGSTGNMTSDEILPSLAYKQQLTDDLAIAFFLNRPYGAQAEYTQGPYTGLAATWESLGTSVVLKYDINESFSAYGGLRYVVSSAEINIPPALTGGPAYTAEGSEDGQTSLIAGVAYQRPEIALRVSLTYEQGYTHEFDTLESGIFETTTSVDMPDALTLAFQTGIAADTLLFGSIRYVEWSVWEVRPPVYDANSGDPGGPDGAITGFDNDTTTYEIGVGRRINDDLSVFAQVGYEAANGGEASRLSPTDGSTSVGIGGSYDFGNVNVTGGVQYIWLGDATDGSGVEFSDNTAWGAGLSVGYQF